MSRWFRWYRGTTENPKFRLAARNGNVTLVTVLAVWQVVLEEAASDKHRGVCQKMEDYIAASLDIPDDGTVEGALSGLEKAGLISVGPGAITVLRWEEWQYEQDVSDPTNAERQKRHRQRKREQSAPVTAHNGGVTARNAPDTDTDTDTDTESEEESASALSSAAPRSEFEIRVEALRAAVSEEFTNRGQKEPADLHRVARWLELGWREDRVRRSIAERLAAARKPIGSLAYFEPALEEMHRVLDPAPAMRNRGDIAKAQGKFYAKAGSPQLEAWLEHAKRTTGRTFPTDSHGGRAVESEWPPQLQAAE